MVEFQETNGGYRLSTELLIERPLDEVFAFFSSARNLEVITPESLSFSILSTDLEMRVGLLIDYRLKLLGIPLKWRSEITSWDPPRRFVDQQVIGPYRKWIHEHTFEPTERGTLVRDVVDYSAPGGGLAHALFVKPQLRKIFEHRHRKLQDILGQIGRA